ncbi:MAG: HAMP domain-containing histidine kinase [Alphaproteobacteria bacterium]|nr:HAMP domain-containing histidine kinase [Alphaproteobacteria bacterium]
MKNVSPRSRRSPFGLSFKLIVMIVVSILTVEVIIYLPSVANFRVVWLEDRIRVGKVAAQVIDLIPPTFALPPQFANSLLTSAGFTAIVARTQGRSLLIQRDDVPMPLTAITADTRERGPFVMITGALDTLFNGGERTLRIVGGYEDVQDGLVEILVPEKPLRDAMLIYSRNIFFLSLIIVALTSAAIFLFLNQLLIRPIGRLTNNMIAFRKTPENGTLIISPSRRGDEIGIAERELEALENDLFSMLYQRKHLADLGLAVAKINHDLRNTLGAAQLLSDQVADLDDPKVQRLAPRLVQTLDRAIGFAQSVLDYGRQANQPPRPQPVDMRMLVTESAAEAGLVGHPDLEFKNTIPDDFCINVDPDQFSRVIVNLLKNAREAIEGRHGENGDNAISVHIDRHEGGPSLIISDTGPGLSNRARDNLFKAFEGSGRAGGTGLGLVIARELTEANGGRLRLVPSDEGTVFAVDIPRSLVC